MSTADIVAEWRMLQPGLRKRIGPGVRRGPWFQYRDAVGFEWNTYQVDLADLPHELVGLRIVQLSDLHCQPFWQTCYDELLDRLNADPPDLIVLTGDIVDQISTPYLCLPTARRLINALPTASQILGILGNHDIYVHHKAFASTRLQLIDGTQRFIEVRNRTVELIAPHGPRRENCIVGFEKTLPEKQTGVPRIVLSHYPDHIRKLRPLKPDVFLAGHTHGGQACLPGGIPIERHDSLPIKYFAGAHRLHDTWFFVSRGLGFSTMQFRLFCPSEVLEVQIMNGHLPS